MELNNATPALTESRDGEKTEGTALGARRLFLAGVYTREHREEAEEGAVELYLQSPTDSSAARVATGHP